MKCFGEMCTAAALCLMTMLLNGCGNGGKSDEVDVAALNAALALRGGAVAEHLGELMPDGVADAQKWITEAAGEGEKTLLDLQDDSLEAKVALASTLGRFRKDVGEIVTNVGEAAQAVVTARQAAKFACVSLTEITNKMSADRLVVFLDGYNEKKRETEQLLAGWKKQRLVKMERGEVATFPTFSAGAGERYAAWDGWANDAASMQRTILADYLPSAQEASSNLMASAAEVRRETALVAEGISKLRAIPADAELVDAARRDTLSVWDGTVQEAVRAMSAWSEDENGCKANELARADKLTSRANAFEKDVVDFSNSHESYLPKQDGDEAKTACANARTASKKAAAEVNDFEAGRNGLLDDWRTLEEAVASAEKSAVWIHDMIKVDEESLVKHMVAIETLRLRIEKFKAVERRAITSATRERARTLLNDEENVLDNAEKKFASAKNKALADEKTARWEAEKAQIRASLTQIKGNLETPPQPGYTRPEGDVRSLLGALEGLLARIDAMTEESLRTEVTKIRTEAKGIEDRTKWMPGARHPDNQHIFASTENGKNVWSADPGYCFVHPGTTDLSVRWEPGARHPDHPNVSAGTEEGSWDPNPGYKKRWVGDLDPEWTIGARHPTRPHLFADIENGKNVWNPDPGYVFVQPNSHNLDCYWAAGRRHPRYEGIESAQEEGRWNLLPGWAWVNPGTSDLRTRWAPGARHPDHLHIHAGNEKWKWSADDGYDFNEYNSRNLSVHWVPGSWHSRYSGVIASRQEGCWEAAAGWEFVMAGPNVRSSSEDLRAKWRPGTWHPTQRHVYASQNENRWLCEDGYTYVHPGGSDLTVRWTPGWVSSDGQRRAKNQEGRFERKHDCPSCDNGWKTKSQRCEICRGTGKVVFGLPCPTCEGNGRVQSRYRCQNCQGVGWQWR